jgi:hypothetical protein
LNGFRQNFSQLGPVERLVPRKCPDAEIEEFKVLSPGQRGSLSGDLCGSPLLRKKHDEPTAGVDTGGVELQGANQLGLGHTEPVPV